MKEIKHFIRGDATLNDEVFFIRPHLMKKGNNVNQRAITPCNYRKSL